MPLVIAAVLPAFGAPAEAATSLPACARWTDSTVASGLGSIENLGFDGRGGLLLAATDRRAIAHLTPDGRLSTLVPDAQAPGGLATVGNNLYFNTGNAAASAVANRDDGTVERFNLDTGVRTRHTSRLVAPNGLALLPGGDLVVSRALGAGATLTRLPARSPERPDRGWANTEGNGLVIDPSGVWLYTVHTFKADSPVLRIDIQDPRRIQTVASLGAAKGPDDLTVDTAGRLYVAGNASGEVFRVDPASGATCVIATGLGRPSAVKFGCGAGWDGQRLYVSNFDGTVRALTPPPGEDRAGLGPTDMLCPRQSTPSAPARVRFFLRSLRSARVFNRLRRLRVSLDASAPISKVRLALTRGRRTYAFARFRSLTNQRRVTVPKRRPVRPGRYRLVLTARDSLGRTIRTTAVIRFSR